MRQIRVGKVTLNVGVGEPGEKLEAIARLLKQISNMTPAKTTTKKRIPEWNVRPGLQIGVKVTIRGKAADELLKRLFTAVENKVAYSKFDKTGNLSFGIPEYVHIPGAKYDYSVGIIGISAAITLVRPGFRVANRRNVSKIGKKHMISREEAAEFIKDKYKVSVI